MTRIIPLLTLLLAAATAVAQVPPLTAPPQRPDTEKPADRPADQPADPNQPPSPEILDLLERIEKRGDQLTSFQADMDYRQLQLLLDTATIRHGWLAYQASDRTVRFRIHFADWLQQDLMLDPEDAPRPLRFNEDFAFDGRWATRRNERTKTLQRVEITRTPQNREDFRLGQGPFPMPFALRKDDVLREFHVALDPDAPEDLHHLILTPRPDSSFAEQYLQLQLWLDRETLIPQRLNYETLDAEQTAIAWTNIQLDRNIPEDRFTLQPTANNWDIEVIPLPDPATP